MRVYCHLTGMVSCVHNFQEVALIHHYPYICDEYQCLTIILCMPIRHYQF